MGIVGPLVHISPSLERFKLFLLNADPFESGATRVASRNRPRTAFDGQAVSAAVYCQWKA